MCVCYEDDVERPLWDVRKMSIVVQKLNNCCQYYSKEEDLQNLPLETLKNCCFEWVEQSKSSCEAIKIEL